ncbi:hypothetical protein ACFQZC_03745 [Streptacidiphilus monticola]
MIADLTSADLTAAPADCLTIFQDRLAAEQRRVACLQAIVHELQEIEQAQARLQALLEGRLPEAADAAPAQAARPVAAAPLVHEPRSRGGARPRAAAVRTNVPGGTWTGPWRCWPGIPTAASAPASSPTPLARTRTGSASCCTAPPTAAWSGGTRARA